VNGVVSKDIEGRRTVLKSVKKKQNLDWIYMTQDSIQQVVFKNMIMNLWVS
jgi:hypothetical protein